MTNGRHALRTTLVRLAADFAEGVADAIEASGTFPAAAEAEKPRAKALGPTPTQADLRRARAALRGTR
jgi:hypothetical protein